MIAYQFTVWTLLALAVQTVLPLLIDLVTTTVTRNGVKTLLLGLLTIAVTVASGLQTAHDTGQVFDLVGALITAGSGFAVSLAAYYKIWRGSRAQAVAQNSLIVTPPPVDPDPAPAAAALPSRHLYVAPTFREPEKTSGDHVLEPVQKDVA